MYKSEETKKFDYHNVAAANFIDETNSFCTKSFLIRYAEETIYLEDICQFRTEIDKVPDFDLQPFYIDIELYFSETSIINGVEFVSGYVPDVSLHPFIVFL